MSRTLAAVIVFLRIPLAVTAVADVLLGALLAGAAFSPRFLLPLLLVSGASVCFYLAGMAWNDIFDRKRDEKLQPSRPLPSGDLSPGGAAAVALALTTTGLLLCLLVDVRLFLCGLALILAVLGYDGGLKSEPWLGEGTMALCRLNNLLLGAGAAWTAGATGASLPVAVAALTLGGYTLLLTRISTAEDLAPTPGAARIRNNVTLLTSLTTAGLLLSFYHRAPLPLLVPFLIWFALLFEPFLSTQERVERPLYRRRTMKLVLRTILGIIAFDAFIGVCLGFEQTLWLLILLLPYPALSLLFGRARRRLASDG